MENDYRHDLSQTDRERVELVTKPTTDWANAERFERLSAGATTHTSGDRLAFSLPTTNISFEAREDFHLGEALFDKLWVSSPSSTLASDGLGPLFNARSCAACHINGGRGHPPAAYENDHTSFVVRLARGPASDDEKASLRELHRLVLPDEVYGAQLQDRAVHGLNREGSVKVSYIETPFTFPDGTVTMLRRPNYTVTSLAYGEIGSSTTISPRIAPPMIGLGLIDAIHQSDILSLADPYDVDGDGISGKPSLVRNEGGEIDLGRFGWKAEQPDLKSQTASAFAFDIGISTTRFPLHRGDCTPLQLSCAARPTGVQHRLGDVEAPDPILDLVTFYSANIAVPARRDVSSSTVLEGKRHFYTAGCVACHTPKFVTSRDASQPEHRFQLIWPYSDLLLHDMGEGLADGQQVGVATGREWRTPPLWGIGLTKTVGGKAFYLHDGRARTLTEAILWHGGEAKASRDAFAALAAEERASVIRFLESL
ncbi:MAG: di-heme oxidoredictase family protein [Pseudomonadota bacterium]